MAARTSVTQRSISRAGHSSCTSGRTAGRAYPDEEIDARDTELGREVTVTLQADEDKDTVNLTLLIPPVRVGKEGTAPSRRWRSSQTMLFAAHRPADRSGLSLRSGPAQGPGALCGHLRAARVGRSADLRVPTVPAAAGKVVVITDFDLGGPRR